MQSGHSFGFTFSLPVGKSPVHFLQVFTHPSPAFSCLRPMQYWDLRHAKEIQFRRKTAPKTRSNLPVSFPIFLRKIWPQSTPQWERSKNIGQSDLAPPLASWSSQGYLVAPPKVKSQLEKADEPHVCWTAERCRFFFGSQIQNKIEEWRCHQTWSKSRQTIFRVRCSIFLWAPSYIIRTNN